MNLLFVTLIQTLMGGKEVKYSSNYEDTTKASLSLRGTEVSIERARFFDYFRVTEHDGNGPILIRGAMKPTGVLAKGILFVTDTKSSLC